MPAGLLPNEGIGDQVKYILKAPIPGVLPWELMLFVNDLVPDFDTVLSELEEATWSGYARRTLERDQWTDPIVEEGCASSTYTEDAQVYYVGVDDDQTNYGAAYVDTSTGVLRWVQRFDDADLYPVVAGGLYKILPRYTLTSAECSSQLALARRRARRKPKR